MMMHVFFFVSVSFWCPLDTLKVASNLTNQMKNCQGFSPRATFLNTPKGHGRFVLQELVGV